MGKVYFCIWQGIMPRFYMIKNISIKASSCQDEHGKSCQTQWCNLACAAVFCRSVRVATIVNHDLLEFLDQSK